MHDLLYLKQDSLGLMTFEELAGESGVTDLDTFEKCNKLPGTVPAIESGIQLAKLLGAQGTPTIALNGSLIGGVPDSATFDRLVGAEVRAAGH